MEQLTKVERNKIGQNELRSAVFLPEGTVVVNIKDNGEVRPQDKYTVRMKGDRGEWVHIFCEKAMYLNHCCSPNCRIDQNSGDVIVVQDVWADSPLTFDYRSTEGRLVESFNCVCPHSFPDTWCAGKVD